MNNTTFAVIAIVSALALFGVVAVTVSTTIMQLQEAQAFHNNGHRFGCVNAVVNSGNQEFFNGTEPRVACK